jgi:solute carrier family 40 (iron-regulated transporter), member 1
LSIDSIGLLWAAKMAAEDAEAEAGSVEDYSMADASITQMSETTLDIEPEFMTRSQAFNLYTSHLLSTWNIRTYEFAAVSADRIF